MDYRNFSEIDVRTSSGEYFFIYWKLTDCYEGGKHFIKRRQIIQYTTGLRILPINFDVIIEFVKLEKGSKLYLITEERWPLGKIEKVPFVSDGDVCSISWKE